MKHDNMGDVSALLKPGQNCVRLQDPRTLVEVKSFQCQLDESRVKEIEKVVTTVAEISKTLETLKTDIFKSEAAKNFDAEGIRKKLIDLEEKMVNTKHLIKDQLIQTSIEGSKLFRDMKVLEKRIEDWSKPVNPQLLRPLKQSSYKVRIDENSPAVEFQKFLVNSGGHCGGWLEHDHLIFLRERRKFKGKNKFLTAVHSFLPDVTFDEISEHENWYVKYEHLRNAQKEAIQTWKARKQQKQEDNTNANNTDVKKESKTNKRGTHQINIAERIKEWKKQQLAKKLEEEERQKEEERQLQKEREKIKEIQRVKKEAINQYKAEKLNRKQSIELLEMDKKSHTTDKIKNSILLKSFRLQDIKFVEKKKIIKLQLESKNATKVERLKLSKSPFDFLLHRDPKRIFKPTLIWNQHCQPKDDREGNLNYVFNLNTIPRLAIPEWRRELK